MKSNLNRLLLACVLSAPLLASASLPLQAATPAGAAIAWHPGFVIRAEDRFDPAIQRLMAEYSLQSLPLERGQLYYLYPLGVTPRLEGVQIRYLESLLDKAAAAEASAETETAATVEVPASPDAPSAKGGAKQQ